MTKEHPLIKCVRMTKDRHVCTLGKAPPEVEKAREALALSLRRIEIGAETILESLSGNPQNVVAWFCVGESRPYSSMSEAWANDPYGRVGFRLPISWDSLEITDEVEDNSSLVEKWLEERDKKREEIEEEMNMLMESIQFHVGTSDAENPFLLNRIHEFRKGDRFFRPHKETNE